MKALKENVPIINNVFVFFGKFIRVLLDGISYSFNSTISCKNASFFSLSIFGQKRLILIKQDWSEKDLV